jgi:flagellar FliJ protein
MAQPKFIFRLEPLLDIRKQAEKDKQLAMAKVQQRINALIKAIQDAQAIIAGQNKQLAAEKLTGTLDLAYIAHQKRYVHTLNVHIAQNLQKIQGEQQNLAAARKELLEASRERKIIEKLREKQHQRWLADQARIESAAIDEIGTQLALRHMSSDPLM